MPRRYKMTNRSTNVEETKYRIVRAATELHAIQGMQGTSYTEIAEKADVAMATVYRHFPTFEELIPACANSIVVLQPVTADTIASIFRGQREPWQRLASVIRGTCECYERDGGWLQAARREGDLIPTLSAIVHEQQKNLQILVQAALEGTIASERHVQVLAALMDFPLWKSLRDMGFSPHEATNQVFELSRDYLVREDLA